VSIDVKVIKMFVIFLVIGYS